MATIEKETGSASATANSYASESDLTTYADDRNITLTATTDAQKADLLIRAMDYIEQQPFKGIKNSDAQALLWPRYGVAINDYEISSDEIPQLLIDALCEAAIAVDGGADPLADVSRETKKEKVGDIEVEYMDGGLSKTYLQSVETKLSKLLKAGSGAINTVAIRA